MDETQIQIQAFIVPFVISLLVLWIMKKSFAKPNAKKNPPPSPPKLPIIGNLHKLGFLPHQNLRLLARKHGPMMLLHFCSVPVLVVSSGDAAGEITRTHDLIFASRPLNGVTRKLYYNGRDVVFAPYGEYWRRAKTTVVLQLLSSKRVQSFWMDQGGRNGPSGEEASGMFGAAFAIVTIEFVLATLVHKFDWKLPNGAEGKNLDMRERPGITVHRDIPLIAVASLSKYIN